MKDNNIGRVINGYKIKQEIKGGGMSQVYLGVPVDQNKNPKINSEKVIIKIISKSKISQEGSNKKDADNQWKKAIDEFQLTWQLFEKSNKNIARPISWKFDEQEQAVIIITEYIDGPSLSEYIKSEKVIPVDRAMYYFKSICEGIKHFHQIDKKRTIIHRDLKADNIMLTNDLLDAKIIDYGIATSFYNNTFESSEGTIYCTAAYTTPDILKLTPTIINGATNGDPKYKKEMSNIITVQFDFHALGVILYEMLTGTFPFKENPKMDDRSKIKQWLSYDLPILSNTLVNVPNSIDNIIFRLTASKPEDLKYRYNNIDEILQDVNTWNDESRKNEPLIKPLEKRNFQTPQIFNIYTLKGNEKFYKKWWFFILVNVSSLVIIILAIVAILLIVFKVI